MRTDPVEAFWERFSTATGVTADYDAWAFGDEDSPDLADELAWLVLHGPKRATTCLYEDAVADGDMPTRGAYSVVLDGSGGPVCVIRTTEVDIRPFGEVDDAYAWDEGEGDRSLAFWRQAHIDFFAQNGHSIEDDTLVVLERFDLLWPRPGEEGWRRYRPADDPVSQLLAGYAAARSDGDVDALVAAHAPGGFAVRAGEIVRHDSAESLTALLPEDRGRRAQCRRARVELSRTSPSSTRPTGPGWRWPSGRCARRTGRPCAPSTRPTSSPWTTTGGGSWARSSTTEPGRP